MSRGSIKLSEENAHWIDILRSIYELESIRVGGPGSYHQDIGEAIWTLDELLDAAPGLRNELEEVQRLLDWMETNRHIMVIQSEESATRYLTRVGEIVRLLGHTYEYWHKGRPGIDATRWLIEDKTIPRWTVSVDEARQRLRNLVGKEIGSGPSVHNLLQAIDMVVEGTAKSLPGEDWQSVMFSEFQIEATEEMIRSQFKRNHERRTQILTAGVGSGKTLAFTMGMMISAVEGLLGGRETRRCHLFLYPRTALARDQFTKLSGIAENIPLEAVSVHFEHMDRYRQMNLTVRQGIKEMYTGGFPLLIVTTLETLKRRLQQPVFVKTMSERLARVVLDEIHLISNLTGTQIVNLLKRLKAISPSNAPLWTGSSATVACPEKHASTVFGVTETDVRVIEPREEDVDAVGLVHHVFLRPNDRASMLGCLVNATGILVHNRRDDISDRGEDIREMCKTIGFADNLDMLGRWNEDLRENERTENDFSTDWGRKHPDSSDVLGWSARQREVPYALRFHNPMSRILSVPPGDSKSPSPYVEIPLTTEGDPCEICRTGQRISFGALDETQMRLLGRLVYREPSKEDDKVEEFSIGNPSVFGTAGTVGTLDLCPYLRAGACFWFPKEDFRIDQIPFLKKYYEFSNVAVSRIYSSKVGNADVEDDDLSSAAFQTSLWDSYGPFYGEGYLDEKSMLPVDIVVSSPSLEVGIDLENVTESLLFKAIRNVSSYRQKVGRAGREKGSDTMNVTLLSSRPTDFHYYRQPRKLTSAKVLDPIPLKSLNSQIMRSTIYMAVWDYLALHAELPESVPLGFRQNGKSKFARASEKCLVYIDGNSDRLISHLQRIAGAQLVRADLEAAVGRVKLDLGILLTPIAGIVQGSNLTCIADLVVNNLTPTYRVQINPNIRKPWERIGRSNEGYDDERPGFDPISLGLQDTFDSLDKMRRCGWEVTGLKKALAKLNEIPDDEDLEAIIIDLERILKALDRIETHGNPIVLFFNEQFNEVFKGEKSNKAYYLSYLVEDLPLFNGEIGDLRFPRPKNLFTNPYEEEVELVELRRSLKTGREMGHQEIGTPLISEVMFSYIPGTWTYRQGRPMKVDVGRLKGEGRNLVASYKDILDSGCTLTEIKKGVPKPSFFGPGSIDIYQPKKVVVERAKKYVMANTERGTIVDFDEDDRVPPKGRERRVKVPKCYLEGWTNIKSDIEEKIGVNESGTDKMELVPDVPNAPPDIREVIAHPLQSNILSHPTWNPKMEVIEYVFSVSRSYTSREVAGATLAFHDYDNMTDIGFGRMIRTEGVHIELNPDTVNHVKDILKKALKDNPEFSPSSLRAFSALLGSAVLEEGVHVSPFVVRDVISIVVYSMIDDLEEATFGGLTGKLGALIEDENRLRELARQLVLVKYPEMREEASSDGMTFPPETEEEIEREVSRICDAAKGIHECIAEAEPDLESYLDDWISTTLLNTFGIAAFNALQRLCGTEDSIGYMPDLDRAQEGRYGVYLYDRSENGNGSSETLKKFFHILYLQRVGSDERGRRLPTEDFLTILEQELLQCPQFHTDMGALEIYHQKSQGESGGLPELGYVHEHSVEVEDVSRSVWEALGIRGREDAWKLPLYASIPHFVGQHFNLERDNVSRACGICWNGCPECVVTDHLLMGSLRGRDYVDKAVLDQWFHEGRSETKEYKNPWPQEMVTGKANLDIGTQSRLCSIGEERLWRSVSLPFTIGVELDRRALEDGPRLIVRDNDLVGLKLTESPSRGTGRAISIGFGRLVWYNLLMTAYLDSLECFDDEKKRITMVFYDITDIPLDEIGMSERMWEAVEGYRRRSGHAGRLERLSDLIGWLASRGFKIDVCIDTKRAEESRVISFLSRLRESDPSQEHIRILTKEIPQGVMHIKGMVTPIGAIDGSANLTINGVRRNDESVNHANVGTSDYQSVMRRLEDALHGSAEWT